MKITEIKDSKVKLSVPKFVCDNIIDEKIPEPMPKTSFFMAVIGPPGSGKSSLSVSLISARKDKRIYRKAFNHVYVICPKYSLGSMANNPFEKHDARKIYHDLNQDTLLKIEEILEKNTEEEEYSLIFIDDCAIQLKDKEIQRSLNKIIANRRHLRASIIMVSQSFRYIPLSTRRLISHLIFFKCANNKEKQLIHEEMLSHIDSVDYDKIYKYCFVDKHDSVMVDVMNGKLYRNFNRLELGENDT